MRHRRGFGRVSIEEEVEGERFFEALVGAPVRGVVEMIGHDHGTGPELPGPESDPSRSTVRSTTAAVTPFSATERARVDGLLDKARSAKAMSWNLDQHPAKSGVEPSAILAALDDYVDRAAVRAAIDQRNQQDPSTAIAMGNPPVDAVFVEAVHQFQRKCFFEASHHDGQAGASTLDSLGFTWRSGLRPHNRANAKAQKRLRSIPVSRLTNGELDSNTWFQHMVSPSFLGWDFQSGVHVLLVQRLRTAERWLLGQLQLPGATPVALGTALGFTDRSEQHKGARPSASTESVHTFGLGMDVKYLGNPFMRRAAATAVLKRSALLVSGDTIAHSTINRYLHSLGADPQLGTHRIYEELSRRNREFRAYLGLTRDPAPIDAMLEQRRTAGTAGVFRKGETDEAARKRWLGLVRDDLSAMRSSSSPFRTNGGSLRDPLLGFLDLHEKLVIALRDHACLAWGAVDLGAGENGSGDMMHFDARVCGVGDRITLTSSAGQRRVTEGHPCLPCVPALLRREVGTALRAKGGGAKRLSRTTNDLGPTPPIATLYFDIVLGDEGSATPMTGVFVPQHYQLPASRELDVILYLHGHKKGMRGFENDMSIDAYWNDERFDGLWTLRESLVSAGRNVILVAPTLGPTSKAGSLSDAGGLDWYLDQVLVGLQAQGTFGSTTAGLGIRHLVLAAHSGGGARMRELARSGSEFASKIRECWAFDSMYSADDPDDWAQWARDNPDAKLYAHYQGVDQSPKRYGLELARKNLPNVVVERSDAKDHFHNPRHHFRARIMAMPGFEVVQRPMVF